MKRLLFLVPFLLQADILSDLKNKELLLDAKKNYFSAKETKNSWINPINLTYSISKDNSLGFDTINRTFSISISQPIFKSGAIYYSIKYAEDLKNLNQLSIEKKRRELIKSAYDLAADYQINNLNRNIIMLNIENAKIEVKKKEEAFLSGVGDSVELNNAILKLNSLKLQLEDIKSALFSIKSRFEQISNLDINKVSLPKIKLINKDEFLNKNIELKEAIFNSKIKSDLYKMQRGNQLLSVIFNASLNHQSLTYETNPLYKSDTKNFYKIGVSFVLPLSINSKNSIQKTKVDFLNSKLLVEDKKRSLLKDYTSLKNQIELINKKISIYKENIQVYKRLIKSIKENILAGSATNLDLEVMQNSLKVSRLNIKILQIKRFKLLLELYYRVNRL